VQQHEAQRLGLGLGQLAGQAQTLGPDDEVLGDQHDLQPHGVVGVLEEGKVGQPGVLAAADAVLDPA